MRSLTAGGHPPKSAPNNLNHAVSSIPKESHQSTLVRKKRRPSWRDIGGAGKRLCAPSPSIRSHAGRSSGSQRRNRAKAILDGREPCVARLVAWEVSGKGFAKSVIAHQRAGLQRDECPRIIARRLHLIEKLSTAIDDRDEGLSCREGRSRPLRVHETLRASSRRSVGHRQLGSDR